MSSKLEKILAIIQREPNYETFQYKGYKCVIKRMMFPGGGQLNGYVGLPEGHKFYKKGYDDIPIECHGGLTFSDFWQKTEHNDEDDGLWYIGFDTAHYRDYMPFMKMILPTRHLDDYDDSTYKDINYVRAECKKIVDQLAEPSI